MKGVKVPSEEEVARRKMVNINLETGAYGRVNRLASQTDLFKSRMSRLPTFQVIILVKTTLGRYPSSGTTSKSTFTPPARLCHHSRSLA